MKEGCWGHQFRVVGAAISLIGRVIRLLGNKYFDVGSISPLLRSILCAAEPYSGGC
jgi:hypothetical protein